MAEHVVRLPDVGEGVAQAELVEWHVKPGDLVREDAILAAVMTDKATVEIPSPVDGEILCLGADIGDMVAVGSELIRLKVAGQGDAPAKDAQASTSAAAATLSAPSRSNRAMGSPWRRSPCGGGTSPGHARGPPAGPRSRYRPAPSSGHRSSGAHHPRRP
ncbi:MAG: 2-oxo acid dehydrogenase subunit [Thermomicrobiales bacterium]|nr:2-oxo acid dehydrogenase subunit [Thermomicrobiales bacterium]